MRTVRCNNLLLGGVCPGGVLAGGVGVSVQGVGVCAQGGVCPGVVSAQGVYPSMHLGRHPLRHGQNSWYTLLKILPCHNFIADGKNTTLRWPTKRRFLHLWSMKRMEAYINYQCIIPKIIQHNYILGRAVGYCNLSSLLRDAPDIHRLSTVNVIKTPLPVGKSVNISAFLGYTVSCVRDQDATTAPAGHR